MNSSTPQDISQMVREHGPFMERLARALTATTADAEDLLHDTWLEALKADRGAVANQRGWLIVAMRRRAGALRRKLRPSSGLQPETELGVEGSSNDLPPNVVERMEAERLLGEALAGLKEPYRTAIYLRYRLEWTPTRIAAESGAPVKTVKTRLSRGLEQLRRGLDGAAADSEGDPSREAWMALLLPMAGRVPSLSTAPLKGPVPSVGLTAIAMKKTLLGTLVLLLVATAAWFIPADTSPFSQPGVSPASRSELVAEGTDAGPPDVGVLVAAEPELGRESGEVAVTMEPPATSLVVTVFDADGETARDGQVVVTRDTGDGQRQLTRVAAVGEAGVARFDRLVAGRYSVEETPTLARDRVDVEPGVETTLEIHRQGAASMRVRGMVVDPDGAPVAGATLWGSRAGPLLPIGRSRADGAYEVTAGSGCTLQASVPGRIPSGARHVHRMDGDTLIGRTCDFTLGAVSGQLAGQVLGADGLPIEGALVTAGSLERTYCSDGVFVTPQPVTAVTDDDGMFRYGHALPEGEWYVGAVSPDGRSVVRSVMFTGSDVSVQLTVGSGATIEGVVLGVDGEPAAGGYVAVRPLRSYPGGKIGVLGAEQYATVDAKGRYRLEGVAAQPLSLFAASRGGLPLARLQVEVPALKPGEQREIDFLLSDGPVLAGVVVDDEGLPIPGVRIEAKQRYGADYRELVTTDAAGRFRLTAVEPRPGVEGRWDVKAIFRSTAGSEDLGGVLDVALDTEDIRIVATRPTPVDAYVEGRVIFTGEELPANVDVAIYRTYIEHKRILSGSYIEVDRTTGTFHHGPVAAGTYRIVARQNDEDLGTLEGIVVGAGETVVTQDLTLK